MMIYISKTGNTLNGRQYAPEIITPRICLNPLYPNVDVGHGCEILLDSGAYQDEENRVSFDDAYKRQVKFQERIRIKARYIVSYDKIGDREISMQANRYLLELEIPNYQDKILVVQGTSKEEYSKCLKELLDLSKTHKFILGFGGVAKAGMIKNIEMKLYSSILENIEYFKTVKRIHIFGCFTERILKTVSNLLPHCELSCDTASCEMRSVMGNVFDSGKWVKTYERNQKYVDYQPCDLALDNVRRSIGYYEGDTAYRYHNLICGV